MSQQASSSPIKRPRYSVVIPTRDRPTYARDAVESVLNQTFPDFEVIVCDNFKTASCRQMIEAFGDPRVRYVVPPAPLSMHDNWEFAIDQARGDFVLILIDKTLLRLSALERLEAATKSHPADIYSWTADAYYLLDEADAEAKRGYLVPVRGSGEAFYVDCKDEIEARVSCRSRLGTEGPSYNYGKICFGAYSRELIVRIKQKFGRVCAPISPDYTSKTVALLSTDRMVDLNGSYTISIMTTISNGRLFASSSVHSRRFLAATGFEEADYDKLPIPYVFCSVHNICGYDWRMLDLTAPGSDYKRDNLDLAALFLDVEEDVAAVKEWQSEQEKRSIIDHLYRFLGETTTDVRERIFELKTRHAEAARDAHQRAAAVTAKLELIEITYAPMFRAYDLAKGVGYKLSRLRDRATGKPMVRTATLSAAGAYPIFESTISALRFAETPGYDYPQPVSNR